MLRLRNSSSNPCSLRILFTLVILISGSSNLAHAHVPNLTHAYTCCKINPLRFFMSFGGGIGLTDSIGQSKTLFDPLEGGNDFFNTNHGTETVGVVDGFFGLEWTPFPMWSLDFGLGYNQTSSIGVNGTIVQARGRPAVDSLGYDYKVVVRQYLVETKLLFNWRSYHPYILAGIGASQNSAFSYGVTLPGLVFLQPQFQNQTRSSLSYIAGLGIDFNVTPDIRFGVGYRFANFGKVQLVNVLLNNGVMVNLSQSNFYVNELIGQISFVLP